MHEQRSLAMFVAINVDRGSMLKVPRRSGAQVWKTDPRLPLAMQRENSLYTRNDWDRGHFVSRRFISWKDSAVDDAQDFERGVSFYSATAPQHKHFNRGRWLSIEHSVLNELSPHAERLVVFAGPIFRGDDLVYRDSKIPRSFWMVVVAVASANAARLEVHAFVADQLQFDANSGVPLLDSDGAPMPLRMARGKSAAFRSA
ncbi:MAG: endonuclease G [Gammaproteobacteria bacterium]|jgi:endonuclease G